MSPKDDLGEDDAALDFALRVGEMLLSNGAGAADVTATMSSITHYLRLRQAQVNVTFTTLSISHQYRTGETLLTASRQVTHRETDFGDLARVDLLVNELLTGATTLDDARSRLARIVSTGHSSPRWTITLSWVILSAAVGVFLGGEPVEVALAGLSGGLLEVSQRKLDILRLPSFYNQIVGGLIVSFVALGAELLPLSVDGSFVVISGIITLLSGLGLIGAFQDALTGFYLTANARVLEVLMSTAGIIAGVAIGISAGRWFGVDSLASLTSSHLAPPPVVGISAAIAATAFAFSAYAPRRSLLPIAVIAGTAGVVYGLLASHVDTRIGPAAIAALLVGLSGYALSRRVGVPPLIVVVAAIVPLLPGLSIYRGLTLLADQDVLGVIALINAVATAIALAAGVILGEYIAQPVRRQTRKLEQRLAGPRLVGPMRARSARPFRRRSKRTDPPR